MRADPNQPPSLTDPGLLERLGMVVDSRLGRIFLVALIILSVLPYAEIELSMRWVFVVAFGAELSIRLPLLIKRRRAGDVSRLELAFIIADTAAFLSFLPLEQWVHRHFEFLTFMRLSRLLVLLRFARELVSDLYGIVTRREQLQQFALVTFAVLGMAFVSAVILNQLSISYDYDGIAENSENFWDRMWWAFRQLESSDNLVQHLHVHPLVGLLSLALTVMGVFIVSFLIGIGTNIVEQTVKAERRRVVPYRGHTIVVGDGRPATVLIREFARIYSKNRRSRRSYLLKIARWFFAGGSAPRSFRLPKMALLGPGSDPPPLIFERAMRYVSYRQGSGADRGALRRIGAAHAKRAIFLGDPTAGREADALTLATLTAFRELNPHAHVHLELLDRRNHRLLKMMGHEGQTFPLEVPTFLGHFLLHHLLTPGVEKVYQDLLSAQGSELYTHIYLDFASKPLGHVVGATPGKHLHFNTMAQLAESSGVILLGVFLGDEVMARQRHDLIPVAELTAWMNPYDEPTDAEVIGLGARKNLIPRDQLRGLIGVADNYETFQKFATSLQKGMAINSPSAPTTSIDSPIELHPVEAPPRRIVVVGASQSLVSFVSRLSQLRPDCEVWVAHDGSPTMPTDLITPLRNAGLELSADAHNQQAPLGLEGRIELCGQHWQPAIDTGLKIVESNQVDAILLLRDSNTSDPDANSALQLIRLLEHQLLQPDAGTLQVLVEFNSPADGERARAQLHQIFERQGRQMPRVTLVSTEQVRNYFMVHSAFVPGISDVYADLLGARGQDLARVPVTTTAAVTMGELRARLARDAAIPIALELKNGQVLVNPKPTEAYTDVVAVYAIGEFEEDG